MSEFTGGVGDLKPAANFRFPEGFLMRAMA